MSTQPTPPASASVDILHTDVKDTEISSSFPEGFLSLNFIW